MKASDESRIAGQFSTEDDGAWRHAGREEAASLRGFATSDLYKAYEALALERGTDLISILASLASGHNARTGKGDLFPIPS
jgi:hypothetical protein